MLDHRAALYAHCTATVAAVRQLVERLQLRLTHCTVTFTQVAAVQQLDLRVQLRRTQVAAVQQLDHRLEL
eukprot:9467983-Pyramimonas_sp.AAC.1